MLPQTQMGKKGLHFRCPQHYCAACHKSGDGVDMAKCIRCPTAYHTCCMPKDDRLVRLAGANKVSRRAALEQHRMPCCRCIPVVRECLSAQACSS